MKYGSLSIIVLLMLLSCVAKNQPASQYDAPDYFILADNTRLVEMDHLGNIYIVDEQNRLSKYDTTGLRMFNVVNNNLGEIHSIDVGNPFKIMIFYRDQQTILLLDNTLSEIQRIRMADWKLQDVTAACLSPDNALWIFDGTHKTLIKMDDSGMPILTSDPFDMLRPTSARPDFIYDADHFLILKEKDQPMSVFNDFGNYLNPLPFEDELFSILNDRIIIYHQPTMMIYSLPAGKEIVRYELKQKLTGSKVLMYGNQFYGFDDKGVFVLNREP